MRISDWSSDVCSSDLTEGIGQGRLTRNLEGAPIDWAQQVTDEEALPLIFSLLKEEGLVVGGSSGINVCGAIKVAQRLGPGHTVVTVLCDYGTRYQSKRSEEHTSELHSLIRIS